MKYLGGKSKLAKEIVSTVLRHPNSKNREFWVEPFVGGANVVVAVPKEYSIIASDIDGDLISLYNAIQQGWEPPTNISEEDYKNIKANPDKYAKEVVGFVSIACSWGGKKWGGYARSGANKGCRNYAEEAKKQFKKQDFSKIQFLAGQYSNVIIPQNSIVYCDPPYADTTGYKEKFNHCLFWEWARKQRLQGSFVVVSEFSAPLDWECVWTKERKVTSSLRDYKKVTEKLFI